MTYLLICLLIGCVIASYLAVEQLILWVPKLLDKPRDRRIADVMAPDHGRPWGTAHPDRPDEDY